MTEDVSADPISALGDDEIEDMIVDISGAIAVLVEGRPALVIADALLRVVADIIANDTPDEATANDRVGRSVKVLAGYVVQARLEPLF